MKKVISIILLFIALSASSQDMVWQNGKQVPVTPWRGFAPNHASEHQFPILTVRLSFHIIQMTGVHNNFENTWHDKIIIRDSIIKWLNGWYSDFDGIRPQDPVFPTDSFDDSRIRFSVTDRDTPRIFFHTLSNDTISKVNGYKGPQQLYDSLVKSNVSYSTFVKDSTMHVFLFAGGSGVGEATAHKAALKLTFWDECQKAGYHFPYDGIQTMAHEIAHNMGLMHVYVNDEPEKLAYGDDIDDTPDMLKGHSNNLMDYFRETEDANYRPLHGLSTLQLAKMRYSLMGFRTTFTNSNLYNVNHVVIKDWCTYNSANSISINSNEHPIWITPRNIGGDLVLQSGSSLTIRTTVGMPSGGSIIVQPGATLIVDSGGRITNVCNKKWKGIYVMGSSTPQFVAGAHGLVILDSAIIEHADIGVFLGMNPEGGGLITATNSIFRNCGVAVQFAPFSFGDSYSVLKNNTFICDSVLRQSVDTNFTTAFILASGINNVSVRGNHFVNSVITHSKVHNKGTGIYALNSSIKVKSSGTPIPDINGCFHSASGNNIFENLTTGIEFNGGQKFSAFECKFSNVQHGIVVKNMPSGGIDSIWRNFFKITPALQYYDSDTATAIYISSSNKFLIDTNTIYFDSVDARTISGMFFYGIHLVDCSNNDVAGDMGLVLKNMIAFHPANPVDTMIYKGNGNAILVKGNTKKIQILCNEFKGFDKDWNIDVTTKIINQPASVPPIPPTQFEAGNIFSYAKRSQITSTHVFTYYLHLSNNNTRKDPTPQNGWTMTQSNAPSMCSETICLSAYYQLAPVFIEMDTFATRDGIIKVYPNPASQSIHIIYSIKTDNIVSHYFELFNAQGKMMYKIPVEGNYGEKSLDISGQRPGLYFYRITPDTQLSGTLIITK